mgnify:CR=1 FL=1
MAFLKLNNGEEERLLYPYNSKKYPWIKYITVPRECKFGKNDKTSVKSLKMLAVMSIAVGNGLISFRQRKRQLEKLQLTPSLEEFLMTNLMSNLLILRKMVVDSRPRCIVAKCQNMTKQNAMVCGLHKKECSKCHSRFCTHRLHILEHDRYATCEECTPRCYKCGNPEDARRGTCFDCRYQENYKK